jgi:arsenite methyltransferase
MSIHPLHETVQLAYGQLAQNLDPKASTNQPASSCCSVDKALTDSPVGDLGVSCGDPVAFNIIRPGDVVLDLGSGAGRDCFLAAEKTGSSGQVIGVDMTPEMLALAEKNRIELGLDHVRFVSGLIESLPVPDQSVDVILSNCVINLSPDKAAVFREAYRVLRPGGQMVVSDVVLTTPLPQVLAERQDLYCGCLSGAMLQDDYMALIRQAGFETVEILSERPYANMPFTDTLQDPVNLSSGVSMSITWRAYKNEAPSC